MQQPQPDPPRLQRTNGSEIALDTRVGQAAISSQVVPLFRVELGPHREPKAKGQR